MKTNPKIFLLLGSSVLLICLIFFSLYIQIVYSLFPNLPQRGQFGDMFGGLNAFVQLITALTFFLNLYYFRKQVAYQAKEVERMGRDRQEEEVEKKFFFLSELYEKGIDKLKSPKINLAIQEEGRDSLPHFLKLAQNVYRDNYSQFTLDLKNKTNHDSLLQGFSENYFKDPRVIDLSRLMNILLQLVLVVKELNQKNEEKFIPILKVLLTPIELSLLGYYSLTKEASIQDFLFKKVGVHSIDAEYLVHPQHQQ